MMYDIQLNVVIIYYTAPYYIIQPSTNDYVQTVFSTATNVTLRCSLSVNIPANMTITWLHNDRVVESTITQVDQTTNTVQLTRRPQDGVYQCVFNDAAGYILRRSITLLGIHMHVCMYVGNIFMAKYHDANYAAKTTKLEIVKTNKSRDL